MGDQIRDYLNIEEACNRISKLLKNKKINGVINICSNKPITIEKLVLIDYMEIKSKKNNSNKRLLQL